MNKILEVFTKEYKKETEYREFMKENIDKFKLGADNQNDLKNMNCGYNCKYSCEECDVPDKVIEFVNGYNQALEDVMKIYNEMQPKLATNVYEFGERIKAIKK